jgi:hypothetical protein
MKKHVYILVTCLLFSFVGEAQVRYPFQMGYGGTPIVPHNGAVADTFGLATNGGGVGNATWAHDTIEDLFFLVGFRSNLVYVDQAFDADLFVSKGYYADYIELKWDMIKYENQVTRFSIYRSVLGSNEDSVRVGSVSADERSWRDEYAESGVMYQYTLHALGIYAISNKFLNYIEGVGFRVPYGRVSGKVTFEGGVAVPNVKVIASSTDDFDGKSVKLNGTDGFLSVTHPANAAKFKLENTATFQGWFLPENNVGNSVLFQKGSQYQVTYNNGQVDFNANGTIVSLTFPVKVDTFFHVAAIRTADSLKLVVLYDEFAVYESAVAFAGTTPANNNTLYIGKNSNNTGYFNGYVDEIRIWSKAYTTQEIIKFSSLFIDGTEQNLTAYYRLNEGVGNEFFDLSRIGFSFNEFHGDNKGGVTWSTKVPFLYQLAVKGITDASGNYVIAGIPFKTDGSTYTLTPSFGIHKFDPKTKDVFLAFGDETHGDINFLDVASFRVTGYVYYKDTEFPVKNVSIKIDGVTIVQSNGSPIVTDGSGKFTVSVPIGMHYVSLEKYGHTFENGRFPDSGLRDFQEDYTFQYRILDTTRVKLIGKIVGGPLQAAKPKGMDKTTNNIGNAVLTLGTEAEYQLAKIGTSPDVVTNKDHFYYKNGVLTQSGNTETTIKANNLLQVEIKADVTSGQYVAYLLPEKYVVKSIVAGTNTFDPTIYHTTIDLSNAFQRKQEVDSILGIPSFTAGGDTISNYTLDSAYYHANHDFIYRVSPTVSVTNTEGGVNFWDNTITTRDNIEVDVIDQTTKYPTTIWPIFSQRAPYEIKVSVFEEYVNGTTIDNVPVIDGQIEIKNDLALDNTRRKYDLNAQGVIRYKFLGGKPEIVGDHAQAMSITASTGNGGAIKTDWKYAPTTGGNAQKQFLGFVLGGLPKGNNFVTLGPDKVDMVIRDPYGSQSYAWYEIGNVSESSEQTSFSNQAAVNANVKASFGVTTTTFAGIGAGIILESESTFDLALGLEVNTTYGIDNTTTNTITNTKKWQTSADPNFVGANGDVFIGRSINIVYGANETMTFEADATCGNIAGDVCITKDNILYKLLVKEDIRFAPEFATGFQYSQDHIENFLLPNWKKLKKNYLAGTGTKFHTSKVTDPNASNYSAPNTNNPAWIDVDEGNGKVWTLDGDSYKITLRIGTGTNDNWLSIDSNFVDTIAFYNGQINSWEQILYQNEKDKSTALLQTNLSYDAGVVYTSEMSTENSEERTSNFEVQTSASFGVTSGFKVMGIGVAWEMSVKNTLSAGGSTTNTSARAVTFGYELIDTDPGDYFSMDVKKAKTISGPVFALRGGQSSCPHENSEVTNYYNPGTVISEATQQREKPLMSCDDAIENNVAADKAGFYTVKLVNNSESGDAAWFMLTVDEQSNQVGANVKMDGSGIGNGRLIFIPANSVVVKTVSIQKANPESAINEFNDIGIILHSACQFDPTNSWVNIADTLELSVNFIPVCTQVNITSPTNQWLMNSTNTDRKIAVKLEDYNTAFVGFESLLLQVKPVTSSEWVTKKAYYNNDASFDASTDASKEKIDGQVTLNHQLDFSSLPDRNYDIKAISTCANGTQNVSEILTGIKDTKLPEVFGVPEPGDGILSPGESVLITFNEPIFTRDNFEGSNVSVRGVLNDAKIDHSAVLLFDGINDNMTVSSPVNLSNKSWTIEMWVKRNTLNTEQVLFQQGDISFGFKADNQFSVSLGNQTFFGIVNPTNVYDFTDKWIHLTVVYDSPSKTITAYKVYDGVVNNNLVGATLVTKAFSAEDKMFVGSSNQGSQYFGGYMHDLRMWDRALSFANAIGGKDNILKGGEIGLAGLWPMNELSGAITQDLSRAHFGVINGPTWQVLPSGSGFDLDGATVLNFDGDSVIITSDMDQTIEMWFKGNLADNAGTVLFSNGKTDGTDNATDRIWEIGFNQAGKLYVKNNNSILSADNVNTLDNEWHHLAVVLRRKTNTSVFIDGNLSAFKNSSFFGGMLATEYSVGASRRFTVGTPYSNYFTGKVDEVRVWKLARTKALLKLDMFSKLKGNEIGLVAYYPFDTYDNTLSVVPTLEEQKQFRVIVNGSFEYTPSPYTMTVVGGGTFENSNLPKIKQARPVQHLAKSIVVASDKVIINLDESPELIEKTVVEFTVQAVEDLHGNVLASPKTWTAFIRNNTMLWSESSMSIEKLVYEPLSFTLDIVNSDGRPEDYSISNLPSWLTASSEVGNLAPNSSKTITFTVNEGINIGNYEESLYLTTDFGFNETFNLSLKVKGVEPDWNFNPSQFSNSMSVIGLIKVDEIVSSDMEDKLVAVVNDQVRGMAQLTYIAEYDAYLALLDVFSNDVSGLEIIDFQIWDASKGKVHNEVTPDLLFVKDNLYGSPSSPIIFNARNMVASPIALTSGWNWISFPVKPDNEDFTISNLFADVNNGAAGDIIKTQHTGEVSFNAYDQGSQSWTGNAIQTLSNNWLYKVKISNADTIRLNGAEIKADTVDIPIVTGWNWIGYVSTHNMTVADAFANYQVTQGDLIKSQAGFAVYDSLIGWIGSLNFLMPTQGYMFKSKNLATTTLTYPDAGLLFKTGVDDVAKLYAEFHLEPAQYQNNMSLIATVDICENIDQQFKLIAYHNGVVRGVGKVKNNVFYLNLFGQVETTELEFKLMDDGGNVYVLNESFDFNNNKLMGSPEKPFVFTSSKSLVIGNKTISQYSIAPTVYYQDLTIAFNLTEKQQVSIELFDVTGKLLSVVMDESRDAGNHKFKWLTFTSGIALPDGVHIIHVKFDDALIGVEKLIHISH